MVTIKQVTERVVEIYDALIRDAEGAMESTSTSAYTDSFLDSIHPDDLSVALQEMLEVSPTLCEAAVAESVVECISAQRDIFYRKKTRLQMRERFREMSEISRDALTTRKNDNIQIVNSRIYNTVKT